MERRTFFSRIATALAGAFVARRLPAADDVFDRSQLDVESMPPLTFGGIPIEIENPIGDFNTSDFHDAEHIGTVVLPSAHEPYPWCEPETWPTRDEACAAQPECRYFAQNSDGRWRGFGLVGCAFEFAHDHCVVDMGLYGLTLKPCDGPYHYDLRTRLP